MQHSKLDEQREALFPATLAKPELGPYLVAVTPVKPSTEPAGQAINIAGIRQAA